MRAVLPAIALLALASSASAEDKPLSVRHGFTVIHADLPTPPGLTVKAAEEEAIRTGRPVYYWLNYACKSSEVRVPDGIHVHTDQPQEWGDRTITTPGVIVGLHNPRRGPRFFERLAVVAPEDVCATNLIRPVADRRRVLAAPAVAAPAWQPAPTFAAPPRAWGGSG